MDDQYQFAKDVCRAIIDHRGEILDIKQKVDEIIEWGTRELDERTKDLRDDQVEECKTIADEIDSQVRAHLLAIKEEYGV